MVWSTLKTPWLTACGLGLLVSIPSAAQGPSLTMLGELQKGGWELRDRRNGDRQQLCLRTGHELIQLRHRQPGCSQTVVADQPDEVTVQYTCPGNGFGRTTIRRESAELVQVNSQGVLNGSPFSLDAEARRVGAC